MTDLEYLKKYYKGNIEDAIKRYEDGEPVQYIVGDVDFYGNIIKVDKIINTQVHTIILHEYLPIIRLPMVGPKITAELEMSI